MTICDDFGGAARRRLDHIESESMAMGENGLQRISLIVTGSATEGQ